MHVSSRWLLLWPGLALLWVRGSWWGLAGALGFTVIGNLLLTASWMWTEWFGPSTLLTGWTLFGVTWIFSTFIALWKWSEWVGPVERENSEDLFPLAQAQYLKGDWYEAESILGRLIQLDPLDIESHLMLASIYRRTERVELARRTLKYLERLEDSHQWLLETRLEREKLNRMDLDGPKKRSDGFSDAALGVVEAHSISSR